MRLEELVAGMDEGKDLVDLATESVRGLVGLPPAPTISRYSSGWSPTPEDMAAERYAAAGTIISLCAVAEELRGLKRLLEELSQDDVRAV